MESFFKIVTEELLEKRTGNMYYGGGKKLTIGDKIIFGCVMSYASLNGIPPQKYEGRDMYMSEFVMGDNGILYQLYNLK